MKKEVNQEKALKMAKYLRIVMNVFFYVAAIAPIVLAIVLVIITILPESKFALVPAEATSLGFSVDGIINFRINPSLKNELILKPIYQAICFMAIIISSIFAVLFKQIVLILKTVENNNPFDKVNCHRLSIVGSTLIIASCLFPFTEVIVGKNMIQSLMINNVQVDYRVDSVMLLVGFLVLILASVFKYGSYLQKEYDTTI